MSILDPKVKSTRFKKIFPQIQESYPHPQILLSEACLIKSLNCSFMQIQLFLTSDYLFFHDQFPTQTKIITKWAMIRTFYEEISSTSYYGFTIIKSGQSQDFYFISSESLENWLKKLTPYCILTNFENDFITIKKIESTTMGYVNLCQDLNTGQECAVKVIEKSFIISNSQIKHIRNEIKSMKLVYHSNCVKFYCVYEDEMGIMILMEYVPHGTLLSRLQRLKKFTENDVARLARNLIDVLMHFNSLQIIHRDLKLDNILMSSSENNYDIKVADFGIATCSTKPQSSICGTPGFIAPEAFLGEVYNGKFDIFSVGAICFTLLTGKMPFPGKSTETVLDKNKEVNIKFDKKYWKNISKTCWNFVQGLLNKDQNSRPSADEADLHIFIFNTSRSKGIDGNLVMTESGLLKSEMEVN